LSFGRVKSHTQQKRKIAMIIECKTEHHIRSTFNIMQQLRPHFQDIEKYVSVVQQMQKDHQFRLICFFEGGICFGAAGFTIDTRLFAGKILYVADLVVDENKRSGGFGGKLIEWLKNEAKNLNCTNVFLDSGVQRAEAHKFYFREGFHIACLNFKCAIS